jgi:hypothetical protein
MYHWIGHVESDGRLLVMDGSVLRIGTFIARLLVRNIR